MTDSRRFASRDRRPLRREVLVSPLPELGLVAADGPRDPAPELIVQNGAVTRLDGRSAEEFDVIDRFVIAHGLDLEVAAEAMALDDTQLARMLVDVDVPRAQLV
ncbi:MAG TPA: propanediol/glycerol family dehydratase large subunit, partial [Gaiella sp.]|nr:propanediol/glycerol family dehydratase large subunit [Gaiella sp.]